METSSAAGTPRCPRCAGRPLLERVPRYELAAATPLWYCPRCAGAWAMGDALAPGVLDPGQEHPLRYAAEAPRRCRACCGHLKPDGVCANCGKPDLLLACPSCGSEMARVPAGQAMPVALDHCATCQGTWFDTGELRRAFSLEDVQGLASMAVPEHHAPAASNTSLLADALALLLRLFTAP